jgi:hypothetical protein
LGEQVLDIGEGNASRVYESHLRDVFVADQRERWSRFAAFLGRDLS